MTSPSGADPFDCLCPLKLTTASLVLLDSQLRRQRGGLQFYPWKTMYRNESEHFGPSIEPNSHPPPRSGVFVHLARAMVGMRRF